MSPEVTRARKTHCNTDKQVACGLIRAEPDTTKKVDLAWAHRKNVL